MFVRSYFASAGAVASILLGGTTVSAEPLPDVRQVASPAEQVALADLGVILSLGPDAKEDRLRELDRLVIGLRQATPFRGLVQFARAAALHEADRRNEARDAVEESIRLLPGFSAPLLLASQIEGYADRPVQAVSYLIRTSDIDPELVVDFPDYELVNILNRLHGERHARLLRQLATRLFEIGWRGQSLQLRSWMASLLIEARVAAGEIDGARSLIPHLVSPVTVHGLLIDKRYAALWATLEEWAGPRQERLWTAYLPELRDRWRAARDPGLGQAYLDALLSAHRDAVAIGEFLPLFSGKLDRNDDYDMIWLASPLAAALARSGRWDEIEQMFTRALVTWPVGSDANALNLLANRGRFRFYRGDFAGAASDLQAAIADANGRRGEVSASALRAFHLHHACTLHALGRKAESLASAILAQAGGAPDDVAYLQLCLDKHDAAREALIAGLAAEGERDAVLAYVQPDDQPPPQSAVGKALWARQTALRKDTKLLKAVSRYGRILPYPTSAGAAVVTLPEEGPPKVAL